MEEKMLKEKNKKYYIIKFWEKFSYSGSLKLNLSFVLDNSGNIKKYSTQQRAEAAAKKRFARYSQLYKYEVCEVENQEY